MSDFDGLHGTFPTALRWSSENGVLGYTVIDPETGERTIELIELGSAESRFAMDFRCRERGYMLIRPGIYDARLSPANSPPPEWPGEDFKPGFGVWLYSPCFGQLRWESSQATVWRVVDGLWEHIKTFKEASAGDREPVIQFTGRREVPYVNLGKTFFAPVIEVIGFPKRAQIAVFAVREPTVLPPPARDSQISFTLLQQASREGGTPVQKQLAEKLGKPAAKKEAPPRPKPPTTGDFIDDEIPPFDT